MNLEEIQGLAKIMKEMELSVLDITENGLEIHMERQMLLQAPTQPHAVLQSQTVLQSPSASQPVQTTPNAPAETAAAPAAECNPACAETETITSPMVGVFYSSSAPGQKAFVSIGDKVKKGDVLCIIEAMKIMNEINSDVDGIITEICVGDCQVVDFGHPMFRIQKTTSGEA